MKFSNKAYKYLDKLFRNSDYAVAEKQIVSDYLTKQGLAPFEKIIEFQLEYSGLELTITNKSNSTFSASLFSKKDIKENRAIDKIEINGELYFHCGEHKTAQFWFIISSSGKICTKEYDETVNVISSSFEKFIETFAFEDLLKQNVKYEHPYFYDLIDNVAFKNYTSNYFLHATASDEYTVWLSDLEDNLIIQKGTWYDRPESFIHVYGKNRDQCEKFIGQLKDKKIIA